jgi:hypothetical protein
MLMTRSDIVALKNLSSATELVPFDSIPAPFKDDFQIYIFGKTIVKDVDNKCFAYPSDIRKWVRVLISKYKD